MSATAEYTNRQKPPKRVFFAAVVVVFFCTVSAADSVGFVPNYIDGSPAPSRADVVSLADLPQLGELNVQMNPDGGTGQATPAVVAVLPERIKISAIGLDLPVQNPATKDINALDTLLQKGPARYVDSAKLGASGNMIIFAHSSHLPIVRNQIFSAFNRIPELKAGDTITIEGGGKAYLYNVTSIRKADVNDDVTIDLSATAAKLTLVTCDTLTGKSARYILEADFVGEL